MALRSEPAMAAGRDQVNPQAGRDCVADVYAQAGISNPIEEIDAVECYVPFSWYEPMWMENLGFAEVGEGWSPREAVKNLAIALEQSFGSLNKVFIGSYTLDLRRQRIADQLIHTDATYPCDSLCVVRQVIGQSDCVCLVMTPWYRGCVKSQRDAMVRVSLPLVAVLRICFGRGCGDAGENGT